MYLCALQPLNVALPKRQRPCDMTTIETYPLVFKRKHKVHWSDMISMPNTLNKSTDAVTTSTLSSSEKSDPDIDSMPVSRCSSEWSSLRCICSIRRCIDLKSAIIVCVSKSVHENRWMAMWWYFDVNWRLLSPSIVTTSASNTHLSHLRHITRTPSVAVCHFSPTLLQSCVFAQIAIPRATQQFHSSAYNFSIKRVTKWQPSCELMICRTTWLTYINSQIPKSYGQVPASNVWTTERFNHWKSHTRTVVQVF